MRIVDEEGVLFEVQLDEVLADAKHETHCHFELICLTICLADGSRATGYTSKGGCVGHVLLVLLRNGLVPILVRRRSTNIECLYKQILRHMHYLGRGSIVSLAILAVDIALWDLRCKAVGLRLLQMAGSASSRFKAYASGINVAPTAQITRPC